MASGVPAKPKIELRRGQIFEVCAHYHGMVAHVEDKAFREGIAPVVSYIAARVRAPVTMKERLSTAESEITALIYEKWKKSLVERATKSPDLIANQLAYTHARDATKRTRLALTPICVGGRHE